MVNLSLLFDFTKKNIVKTLEGEAVVKSLISFAFVVIFSSEQQLAFLIV